MYVSMSALIAFSTPVPRTVISQWMTSCNPPQRLAEGCDLPLIPSIKIVTSLDMWIFCERGSYFEKSLDIFSKFILLQRFSSRFKFNKHHTSKISMSDVRKTVLKFQVFRWIVSGHSDLQMGSARFSETSFVIYESTLRHGPEDLDLFQKVLELFFF